MLAPASSIGQPYRLGRGIGGAPNTIKSGEWPPISKLKKMVAPTSWGVWRQGEIGACSQVRGLSAAPILLLGPFQQYDLINNAALQSVAALVSVM